MDIPLTGLRVLEWGQDIDAPFCTKIMASLGADVIKIEPLEGDISRRRGPFPNDIPHPERSGLFLVLNTGKRGITLNADNPTGRDLLFQLVKWADVMVENHAASGFDKLGFSRDTLWDVNPSLVLTSITPFGLTGPYKDYLSSDMGLHAISGEMFATGGPPRPPLKRGGETAYYLGGLDAFIATVAACFRRKNTGRGEHLDVSLAEGLAAINRTILGATSTGKRGTQINSAFRPQGIYPTKDGHMGVVRYGEPPTWQDSWEQMMRDYPPTPQVSGEKSDESFLARLREWLMEHTKEEVYHLAQKGGHAFGLVATAPDLLSSPQLKHRHFFQAVENAHAPTLTMAILPALFNGEQQILRRAPMLGEHNETVYCDMLGLTKQDLVLLRQLGVV